MADRSLVTIFYRAIKSASLKCILTGRHYENCYHAKDSDFLKEAIPCVRGSSFNHKHKEPQRF
ncbi:MAG: hypothetical protein JWP78_165 [Mucilaginibacter sp.]|nr:hypothetical protein [Mucilaginibacter sp.]